MILKHASIKIFPFVVTVIAIYCFLIASTTANAAIATVTLYEKDGVTTNNYPLTFGHIFKQGDASSNVYVKIGESNISTQCDIKSTYSDGSIRFAVISLLVPTVPANGTVTLSLESGGTNANSSPLNKSQIQATNIDAQIALTGLSDSGYSGNLTADLSTAINDTSSLQYWLSGDVVTEVIVQQRLNNSLNAVWEVRFYPGTSYKRISHVIENIEANYRGNIEYAVDISQGTPTLSSVYSRRVTGNDPVALASVWGSLAASGTKRGYANFSSPHNLKVGDKFTITGATQSTLNGTFFVYDVPSTTQVVYQTSAYVTTQIDPGTCTLTPGKVQHNHSSKWRKTFWVGSEPPEVEIHYNLQYLISTGMIPNYDTSLVVPESTIASQYASYTDAKSDIMGNGLANYYFPTTGGRQEIGFFPTWTARYLLSMDNRMREIMLKQADVMSGCPIHYREFNPAKTFYGKFVNIDDRPKVFTVEDYINSTTYDPLGAAIGTTSTQWTVDGSHQGSFNFVPYIVTGEYYYLQEMQYWAGWNLSSIDFNADWGRNFSYGRLADQIRGTAWRLRNIAHAAALSLDGSPEKSYFTSKVENNISAYAARVASRPLRHASLNEGDVSGGVISSLVKQVTSGWMEDFFLIVLNEIDRIGFDTEAIVSEYSKFVIGRFAGTAFNPYWGADYRFPTILTDNSPVDTWALARTLYTDPDRSTWTAITTADGYRHIARAALAGVTSRPNGQTAYDWVNSHINFTGVQGHDPTWEIMPLLAQGKRYPFRIAEQP